MDGKRLATLDAPRLTASPLFDEGLAGAAGAGAAGAVIKDGRALGSFGGLQLAPSPDEARQAGLDNIAVLSGQLAQLKTSGDAIGYNRLYATIAGSSTQSSSTIANMLLPAIGTASQQTADPGGNTSGNLLVRVLGGTEKPADVLEQFVRYYGPASPVLNQQASDWQLDRLISVFNAVNTVPANASYASALQAEKSRRAATPAGQTAARAVREADLFFGGLLAAPIGLIGGFEIAAGGGAIATGIGGLSIASGGNSAASVVTSFLGNDRPALDYVAGNGATRILDTAAGVTGLAYGGAGLLKGFASRNAATSLTGTKSVFDSPLFGSLKPAERGGIGIARAGDANFIGPVDFIGPRLPAGRFSISDWSGYPANLAKPQGPFRLIGGVEYDAARSAANNSNRAMHRADPTLSGFQIHEIQPVKFGGSPTDPLNKIPLTRSEHSAATTWWNRLQRDLGGK
jgi:hypothetical protein